MNIFGLASKRARSALAKGECSPEGPSAASWPERVALAMSSDCSGAVTRLKPRKPLPEVAERLGHCGKGLLRQASRRTICCGALPSASNSLSASTARLRLLVVAVDLHVGRGDDVLAADLHAVTGIVGEGDGRLVRGFLEILESIEKIGAVEVVIFEDLEAVLLQDGGDGLGVGNRIIERRQRLVVAHADDERDPPRLGRRAEGETRHQQGKPDQDPSHRAPHASSRPAV